MWISEKRLPPITGIFTALSSSFSSAAWIVKKFRPSVHNAASTILVRVQRHFTICTEFCTLHFVAHQIFQLIILSQRCPHLRTGISQTANYVQCGEVPPHPSLSACGPTYSQLHSSASQTLCQPCYVHSSTFSFRIAGNTVFAVQESAMSPANASF